MEPVRLSDSLSHRRLSQAVEQIDFVRRTSLRRTGSCTAPKSAIKREKVRLGAVDLMLGTPFSRLSRTVSVISTTSPVRTSLF